MIKFTTFVSEDSSGKPLVSFLNNSFEKTASYKADVQDFISQLEKKADCTYVLVNAMTSGDYYGPNLNGDYFPDEQLVRFHKTFEKHAYAYRHHKNKDPKESSGKVIYASHNPDMHRVELVVELDNTKAADIIERMKLGEFPAVSMGTRTPSDRCSICGNRAKNIGEYCDHLKYEMRQVKGDGRRVYAINDDRLTFFDISFVRIPADRTAGVIAKVASAEKPAIPSALIGEEWLKHSGLKESALTKEVPATIEGMSEDPYNLIYDSQKAIPKEKLDKLAEEHSLKDILSTFLGLRIMPKPEEFQRLVLISSGRKALADQVLDKRVLVMDLEEQPEIPIDVTLDGFNHEIAAVLKDDLADLSLTKPLIIKRVLLKRAELEEAAQKGVIGSAIQRPEQVTVGEPKGPRASLFSPGKNPLIPLAGIGALYGGFAKLMNTTGANYAKFDNLDAMLLKNPYLIPLFVGAVALGTKGINDVLFHREKTAAAPTTATVEQVKKFPGVAKALMIGIPASYIYAGHQENKLQKGQPISKLEDTARRHPFLTGLAGIGTARYLWPKVKADLRKLGSLDRIVYGLGPEKFNELYNDVVGITTS